MDLRGVTASLLRRWYVVLLGLALTTGLVYLAYTAVPPTYSAQGSVLLLPPGAAVPDGSNALLQLGGLELPASLVVAYLTGDAVREPFDAQYPDATYEVVLDPVSRGPLIVLTVSAPTPDSVMDALGTALANIPDALASLQDQVDAPPSSRVRSTPLSVDTEPTTVVSATVRAVIAAAGLGLGLTLIGTVGVDSLASRRAERRTSSSGATAASDTARSAHPEPTASPGNPADDAAPLLPQDGARYGASPTDGAAPRGVRTGWTT